MLIEIPSDLLSETNIGTVIKLDRKENNLLIDGKIVYKNLPQTMQRNHYFATIREPGVLKTTISVARFADLHRHSDCSLLDGITKISEMVKYSVPQGALTDHGNMYGFLEFYKAMRKAEKKPIIGFEAYVENIDGKTTGDHLILLAKNLTGYHNIIKLCSYGYENLFRNRPHLTIKLLKEHSEGIIATSACISGTIARLIRNNEMDKAEQALKLYHSIFGDDFYLEVQRHGISDEDKVSEVYKEWSKKFAIKVIATTDSHYPKKEDSGAHEIALCLKTKKTLNEPHMRFSGTGYHIHTSEEMEFLFSDWHEALENTLELADKCSVEIRLGDVNLPTYPIPAPFENPTEYFEHLCKEGFINRFQGKPEFDKEEYKERYEYEMEMIKKMGFVSYFIIVWDFINYARSHNIYVGPGRGSAAGSLLAYCIGMTDLDPLKYNLLFERFLNPERVSWPDVDTDFEHTRRAEVIEYIKQRYGETQVCRIITFGSMAARMVIKDVGRTMGFPASFCSSIAKLIPAEPKMTILKALDESLDFKQRYETESDVKKIVDMGLKIEGCKRHASQHACGLVIGPSIVSDYLPTAMVADEKTGEVDVTSQVVMTEVEELSLLKMDMLGLKNLSVIHECIDGINKKTGKNMDYHDIPMDDRTVLRFLAEGNTGGVFQLESPGMTNVVTRMLSDIDSLPDSELHQGFERMIAAVALYRPGPMAFIDDFIDNMRNHSHIKYDCPELESILKPTYGIIVYQEQVMQIVQKLAGYTLGRADLVRKAMGKKKLDVMEKEREVFIYGNKKEFDAGKDTNYAPGCLKNGIPEEVAITIWNKMADFAKYAFNRSHAACYAYVSMITAWLSCYYPQEFYAAMLNAFNDITDKFNTYLSQVERRKIKMLPPDINISKPQFTVENDAIRFGLRGIKGMNKEAMKIEKERDENGVFTTFQSMLERMDEAGAPVEKKAFEAMLYSGTLDCFGYNKASLEQGYQKILTSILSDRKAMVGQVSLFGGSFDKDFEKFSIIDIPTIQEYKKRALMEKENEVLGFYLSEHPATKFEDEMPNIHPYKTIEELNNEQPEFTKIMTVGLVKELRRFYTKKGDLMYGLKLESKHHSISCVVFPKNVEKCQGALEENRVVMVEGNCTNDEERGLQIIANSMIKENDICQSFSHHFQKLLVPIYSKEEQVTALDLAKTFHSDDRKNSIQLILIANGRQYLTKKKVFLRASMEVIDQFLGRFPTAKLN